MARTKETVGDIEVWAVDGYECLDCVFINTGDCKKMQCESNERKDKRQVIFKPINENNSGKIE